MDDNFAKVRIILWIFGSMSDAERRYSMLEKEMLAVVRALKDCVWLTTYSRYPIKVYIDHKGIIDSVRNLKQVYRKLGKYIDLVEEFNVEYVHRLNTTKIMKIADRMSRLPENLRTLGTELKRRMAFEVSVCMTSIPSRAP